MLRAYLWGIETPDQVGHWFWYRLCCEPTYEELKLFLTLQRIKQYICRCEPTYEELKLKQKSRQESKDWGCEPTYEELKLGDSLWAGNSKESCEPTYEELKLVSHCTGVITLLNGLRAYLWGIETIPACPKRLPAGFSLRAYLWGIETKPYKIQFCDVRRLRAYLWGIETPRNGTVIGDEFHQVASLPMRNWNIPIPLELYKNYTIVASLPMRNWNFKILYQSYCDNTVASLPMRNWNMVAEIIKPIR